VKEIGSSSSKGFKERETFYGVESLQADIGGKKISDGIDFRI